MIDEQKKQVAEEMTRIGARSATVRYDPEYAPEVGTLVFLQIDASEWHFQPPHFLELLKDVPDEAGPEGLKRAIEKNAMFVWHGEEPPNSRDR